MGRGEGTGRRLRELCCWLHEHHILIVKADRQEPLVFHRMSPATEIAEQILETAGKQPFAKITTSVIMAGRDRRSNSAGTEVPGRHARIIPVGGAIIGQIDPMTFFPRTFGCVPRSHRYWGAAHRHQLPCKCRVGVTAWVLRSDVPALCHER